MTARPNSEAQRRSKAQRRSRAQRRAKSQVRKAHGGGPSAPANPPAHDESPDPAPPETKPLRPTPSGAPRNGAGPRPAALQLLERRVVRIVPPSMRDRELWRVDVVRYALLAVAIVCCAALGALAVAGFQSEVYAARSEVLYQLEEEQGTGFLREDRQLSTQLVMIESRDVLAPVAEQHDLSVAELEDKVHAGVVEGTEVLRIDVHDGSAERAETLGEAVTKSYLGHAERSNAAAARTYLEQELTELDAQQATLAAQVAGMEAARLAVNAASQPGAEERRLAGELDVVVDRRAEVQSRLEQVALDEIGAPRLEEITPTHVLDDPVAPRPWRAALVGAFTGVVIAAIVVAVALRRRASDARVR